jgi:uncharacterized membrane protein
MRNLLAALVLLAFLVSALLSPQCLAAETVSTAENCPSYRSHLLNASNRLKHADRASALAELRRARQALAECMRREEEESGEVAVAACDPNLVNSDPLPQDIELPL